MANHHCALCDHTNDSPQSFVKHVSFARKLSAKEYYDKFIGKTGCVVCGKETAFDGIVKGYKRTCGHSCGCKLHRKELSEDPVRSEIFSEKVRARLRKFHASMDDQTAKVFHQRIGEAIKATASKMTDEERRERYGWQNKRSPEEMEQWKNEVMRQTGMFVWWKTASEQEKNELYIRRFIAITKAICDKPRKTADDFVFTDEDFKTLDALFGTEPDVQ